MNLLRVIYTSDFTLRLVDLLTVKVGASFKPALLTVREQAYIVLV
jgi:hypothetical protein